MFIALALTLCTLAGGSTDEQCNTYFIDAFAGPEGVQAVSMGDQWWDCMTALDEETILAKRAATTDGASKPSAKDGLSTVARKAYLARFNIKEDMQTITSWHFGCHKVKEDETP